MTTDPPSGFGELLRRSRVDADLTQEELAERAGVSARAVSNLERGVNMRPRYDTLRRLAQALQLSPEERGRFEQLGQDRAEPFGRGSDGAALPTGNFLGALPAGPLVGRKVELEHLIRMMAMVEQRQGRLVLLVGEPGIGKTRLAQELTVLLREREVLLAAGRCTEADETVPYHPFVEALSALYHLAPLTLRTAVSQDWPQLTTLLLEERARAHPQEGVHLEDQQLLFYTVTRFLEAMTGLAPLALLLDDLHWADGSSLKLLTHLAHHTRTLPVLLLGTYRDVEVDRQHPFHGVLHDLQRADLVERITVERLNEQETGALAEATLGGTGMSAALTTVLYHRTEGNPFFLQQVVRSMVERGEIDRQDGHWTRTETSEPEVPESIRSVIGHRFSRLSSATQEVLHQASVLGQIFSFDDLQTLSGRSEDELDTALSEAARAGLVREADADTSAFGHALTQQTLYDELSARRKRILHRAAGAALEKLPERQQHGRIAELARHFLRGGDPEKALTYSLLAGDAAGATTGYAEAELHYQTAEDLAGELEDVRRVAEAQERRGGVLGVVGRLDEAVTVLEQAAERYAALGDLEGEARVVAELGVQQLQLGTPDASIGRIQEMLGLLEETDAAEIRANLSIVEAGYYASKLRFAEALQSGEYALEAARRTENARCLSRALMWTAGTRRVMGQPEAAIQLHQEAVALTEVAGDVYWAMMAVDFLGQAYYYAGELELALPPFERAFALAQRLEDHDMMAFARASVATTLFDQGRWAEAECDLRRALSFVPLAGAAWGAWHTLTSFGAFCIATGRWAEAEQHLTEALTVTEQHNDLQWHYWVLCALAELDLLRGHSERALTRLEPIRQHPAADPGVEFNWSILGWTLLEVEEVAEAAAVAHRGLHPANGSVQRLFLPAWLELSGVVAGAQGHGEEATQHLEQGMMEAQSIGMPYYEARQLYRLGLMQAQKDERQGARIRLEAALTIFQRLGARPFVEQTKQALQVLG